MPNPAMSMTARGSAWRGKEAGIGRIVKATNGTHVGMAVVIGPRHVITCAHVVNMANGDPARADGFPAGVVKVAFPLSASDAIIDGRVDQGGWHPMRPRIVADLAIIELDRDVPGDVGGAIFADVGRPLDGDRLNIFGVVSDDQVGNHVEAEFRGPTTGGQAQIDTAGSSRGLSIVGGFSGAAVWDSAYQAFVGLVRAINPQAPDTVAYMIPTSALRSAWPPLPVEERWLPRSFNWLWTVVASLFFVGLLVIFLWNRGPWYNDQLSAFIGANVYAVIAPIISLMWFRYALDFRLHGWSSRIPRFANFRADENSRPEKVLWFLTVFFVFLLPLYAQGHFIRTIYNQGYVLIYPEFFGYTDSDLTAQICPNGDDRPHCICRTDRRNHLCQHPSAGLYTFVPPKIPEKGGYWNNYYHYADESSEGASTTFFPFLQPFVILYLSGVSWVFLGGALYRTFALPSLASRMPKSPRGLNRG